MQKQAYTLASIAKLLQAEIRGNPDYVIDGIASLDKAQNGQISFLEHASFRKYLATTKAAIILAPKDLKDFTGSALLVDNPYASYALVTSLFANIPARFPGIHSRAVVGQGCFIDHSVSIGANCTIGDNVTIGENSIIEAGCVIGDRAKIGSNCRLYPNVTVYYDVQIGNSVIIHGGAVIGADGFGMANDKGVWRKIYQLGAVQIGNDVEIGANTCIDRGALEDTIIEDGVKLDNLIQVGHNVKIGAHTVIAGCTAVAGSTTIGRHCMIGGATTINGHISIADQVVVTGSSTVGMAITEKGIYSSGLTVQPHRTWVRTVARILQLDGLIKKLYKGEQLDG